MKPDREGLRRRLEYYARTIEVVMENQGITAVVTGGKVSSQSFHFHVQLPISDSASQTFALRNDLAWALTVPQVEIACQGEQMTISFNRVSSSPLPLQTLMETIGEFRPLTAVLGQAFDRSPITLHLATADMSNILIAGQAGAGKTTLLRTLLYSLATQNKQHQFQALVIDYNPTNQGDSPLAAFSHLPHLLRPVATAFKEAVSVLDFLVEEMAYRIKQDIDHPKIMLVIDNLDLLLNAGQGPLLQRLLSLLEDGSTVGIHLILVLESANAQNCNQLLKCELPVRFIGRVGDDKMARALAGVPETGAEFLAGQGDFIGLNGGHQIRFRAAYIGDYDLYLGVERLSRQSRKKLIAAPTIFPAPLEFVGSS